MNAVAISTPTIPPAWALWERYLITWMSRAALEFVSRYTRPDGSLVWRETWPGMDGSDDAYESFFNYPLLYALGGPEDLDATARAEWEAITRQFTAYGQVYREFDAYYDWMHHGESSQLFYYFGLARPDDARTIGRARRFAAMYTGHDSEAPNYDPLLRLIRSPINGSRGPRFENSGEDWVTHRPVLAHYPPPFDDVLCDENGCANWNDVTLFAGILEKLNARMMRGDVPLNLAATSLVANAFLYTGDTGCRNWVTGYVDAWIERARQNGGLLPDNVGLSGQIGEYMEGRWWGGYYGWKWPHGWMNLSDSAFLGSANALLLSGDRKYLSLIRSQLDQVQSQGRRMEGRVQTPHRFGSEGWYDFRPASPRHAIHLWALTHADEDERRVEDWTGDGDRHRVAPGRGKGDDIHAAPWYEMVNGRFDSYPEAILQANHAEGCRRQAAIRADTGNPEEWDVHHWQDLNPVVCEGLAQLTLGGPAALYHGGLLLTQVRYFDAIARRPGLPPDVAALVYRVDGAGIELELVNLSPLQRREVILQAGAFAEHRFTGVRILPRGEEEAFDGTHLAVELAPGAGGRLHLSMERFCNAPTYRQPL